MATRLCITLYPAVLKSRFVDCLHIRNTSVVLTFLLQIRTTLGHLENKYSAAIVFPLHNKCQQYIQFEQLIIQFENTTNLELRATLIQSQNSVTIENHTTIPAQMHIKLLYK